MIGNGSTPIYKEIGLRLYDYNGYSKTIYVYRPSRGFNGYAVENCIGAFRP